RFDRHGAAVFAQGGEGGVDDAHDAGGEGGAGGGGAAVADGGDEGLVLLEERFVQPDFRNGDGAVAQDHVELAKGTVVVGGHALVVVADGLEVVHVIPDGHL